MITLIYGDDVEKIENTIISMTSNYKVDRLDGKKLKIKELEEQVLGKSLFGDESIYLIEGLLKNKNKKVLLDFLFSNKDNITAILVQKEKLNKKELSTYKFNHVLENMLPQYYFKFLDEFYPNNSKTLIKIYNELLKTMTAEQIYYSLVKRIRALIAVKANALTHSEINRFAPWQLSKLKLQANMWPETQLIDFYKKLFEIEVGMKSSRIPLTLEKYLDIAIITGLN